MIKNLFGNITPILHLPGNSFNDTFLNHILPNYSVQDLILPPELSIITTFDKEEFNVVGRYCLDPFNINYVNSYKYSNNRPWYTPHKITYIDRALQEINSEYCLILDSRDVLIYSLDNLSKYLEEYDTEILFNATSARYPNFPIDIIDSRDNLGYFCYLNAGCALGLTKSLRKFYKEAKAVLDKLEKVPFNSEQFIIRMVFSKYSNNVTSNKHKFVTFDYKQQLVTTGGGLILQALNPEETEFQLIFNYGW